MGIATGNPRGRPPGARNKRTEELQERAQASAKAIEKAIKGAFDGDAHALMMTVYKNPAYPIDVRLDAAKAAVRFEKPSLAAVEHSGGIAFSHEDALDELEPEGKGNPSPAT